jgi:hypothetical protein
VPNPWDNDPIVGASQAPRGPMYGAPPLPPDQFKIRDQQLQEEANRRAQESERRAAEDQKFQREKFGVEMDLKRRELDKKQSGTALPVAASTDYEGKV